MTIGSDLREAREQHGLTLGDISTRTKIRVQVLRAIESDDFDHVPGGVIARGFLKLYAREVGLDPDQLARRFNALHAPTPDSQATTTPGELNLPYQGRSGHSGSRSYFPALLVIAAIAGLAGYMAWSRTARAAPPPERGTVESPPPIQASRPDAVGGGAAAAETAPPVPATVVASDAKAAAEGVLSVDVHANDASWLAATADGQQVAYRLLNAGDQVSLSVKTLAVLRIGIPANVKVTINGAEVKPFGVPGNPATLRITPDNYRTLLP